MSHLKYMPHCLRHGVASADAATGFAATDVHPLGQWRDMWSVARYMKKGALLRQLARLSRSTRRVAAGAEAILKRRLPAEILRVVTVASRLPAERSARKFFNPSVTTLKRRRQDGPIAWSPKSRTHPS